MITHALKADPKPLYIQRKLVNSLPFIEWATSQGFSKVITPEELHVTIVYSKQPIDWDSVLSDSAPLTSIGGPRSVERLGDKGAVVLKFESQELSERHNVWSAAGASWDYEGYIPHVTITYDAGAVDLTSVKPFTGSLEFGPEIYEVPNEDYVEEKINYLAPVERPEVPKPPKVTTPYVVAAIKECCVSRGHQPSQEFSAIVSRMFKRHTAQSDLVHSGSVYSSEVPKVKRKLTLGSFERLFKGAPLGNQNAKKNKPGSTGLNGEVRSADPNKTWDGQDIPTYTVEQLYPKFEELKRKGIKSELTPEQFHEKTKGRVDPVEMVKAIWGEEEYRTGKVTKGEIHEHSGGMGSEHLEGGITFSGSGQVHGSRVEWVERTLHPDMQAIDHTYLKMAKGEDNKGTARALFRKSVPLYKRMGLKAITVHANLEAGAYAWSKFGFAADNLSHVRQQVEQGWASILRHTNAGIPKEDRKPLSKDATDEMNGLRDILASNDRHMALKLASFPTPNLDAHFGHVFDVAKDSRIPKDVKMTFIKTAMSGKDWDGTLRFDDPTSSQQLDMYLRGSKKTSKP
jgi:hypothetical protein